MRNGIAAAAALCLLATPAAAQKISPDRLPTSLQSLIAGAGHSLSVIVAETGDDCSGGIAYDNDGTEVIGIGYEGPTPAPDTFTAAMRFNLPTGASRINAVCLRMAQSLSLGVPSQIPLDIDIWAADGAGGAPGTLLGSQHNLLLQDVPEQSFCDATTPFYRIDLPSGITVNTNTVYIGATWGVGSLFDNGEATTELCGFADGAGGQPAYDGGTRPPTQQLGIVGNIPVYKSLSIRAEAEAVNSNPPSVPPLLSSQYPNFRFWVRIGDSRIGTAVAGCLPETVCVAGSIPTRAEVFVRIVGPKANGYLWPNIVKFNTTKTEVWIQQISTGSTKYYLLPALPTDSSTLPGVVDKTGFLP